MLIQMLAKSDKGYFGYDIGNVLLACRLLFARLLAGLIVSLYKI
jgi:hypothetical protein